MFEQKVLDNSNQPIRNLYPRAVKASENPLTGITKTTNKYVELVIRDCATVAKKYLPIMVYGSYQDPINTLKGKIEAKEIIDLVGRSEKVLETRQLLKLVLSSAQKYQIDKQLKTNDLITDHETKDPVADVDDVYGDYGESPPENPEQVEVTDLTNLTTKEIANFLIKIFEAK
ncbi:hypothetical protein KY334_01975 [Candidatus Woesearchaeota archaeon]|nr:hypothetical protein [Candidatus Woesearchaeota archaeon]